MMILSFFFEFIFIAIIYSFAKKNLEGGSGEPNLLLLLINVNDCTLLIF